MSKNVPAVIAVRVDRHDHRAVDAVAVARQPRAIYGLWLMVVARHVGQAVDMVRIARAQVQQNRVVVLHGVMQAHERA